MSLTRAILGAVAMLCWLGAACTVTPTVAESTTSRGENEAQTAEEAPAQLLEGAKIELPTPRTTGGIPLMKALKLRRTHRRISEKQLPIQTLSDLLWAGFGVNRPDNGKRTAPTATDAREIDVYVALKAGLYLYKAEENRLDRISSEDIRALTGKQSFAGIAPVDLVFVSELERFEDMDLADREFYSATDTGYISQNIYLFCASEGLATVAVGYLDRSKLARAMKLRSSQRVILSQPVGYPR